MRLSARVLVSIGSALFTLKSVAAQVSLSELNTCDPKVKVTVSESSSGALFGMTELNKPTDRFTRSTYTDACGTNWGQMVGKRSVKGSVIPYKTLPTETGGINPCDNVTLSLSQVSALAVDASGTPFTGNNRVNGLVSITHKNGAKIRITDNKLVLSAELLKSESVSDKATGYLAIRNALTEITYDPMNAINGNSPDVDGPKKFATFGSSFCSYGSTTLNTALTTDAAPTLSLGYEPIRNQFTVTIDNPTDKTFTGIKAVVRVSPSITGTPSGQRTFVGAQPAAIAGSVTTDLEGETSRIDLRVLNRGAMPPKSKSTYNLELFAVGAGLTAVDFKFTLEVTDAAKTSWTKEYTYNYQPPVFGPGGN